MLQSMGSESETTEQLNNLIVTNCLSNVVCCVQSYVTFCNLKDCSLLGSSVHGIFQAILEWVVISSSRGSS